MTFYKRFLFWSLLIGLTASITLLTMELLARAFISKPHGPEVSYINKNGFYTYPYLFKQTFLNEDGVKIPVETDEYGLRNQPGTLNKSEVIILGDSFIMAANTTQEQTLVGRLQQAGIKAYNAGMDGYGTFNSLDLLRSLLEKTNPTSVVLGFYLGNDFHDNYLTNSQRGERVMENLTDSPSGKPYGVLRKLIKNSAAGQFLYIQVYRGWLKSEASNAMASYPLSEILSYRLRYNATMEVAVEKTSQALFELAKFSREKHFCLYVMGIPSKAQVYRSFHEISNFDVDKRSRDYALQAIKEGYSFDRPEEVLKNLAAQNGLEYISVLQLFRKNLHKQLYYQIDAHWTDIGQQLAAEYLVEKGLFSRAIQSHCSKKNN